MKYHFTLKLLAIFLAACMLAVFIGSAVCCLVLVEEGLYTATVSDWQSRGMEDRARELADHVLRRFTATELGNLNGEQLSHANRLYTDSQISDWYGLPAGSWDYWITDMEGNHRQIATSLESTQEPLTYRFTMNCEYPVHVTAQESAQLEQTSGWSWRDYYYTDTEEHFLYYYLSPTYQVTVRLLPQSLPSYRGLSVALVTELHSLRHQLLLGAVLSLLLFLLSMVYLGFAAGKTGKAAPARLRGLTRAPLDLLLAAAFFGCFLLGHACVYLLDQLIWAEAAVPDGAALTLLFLVLFAGALVAICFLYVLFAQCKQPGGQWWRRSVVGRLLLLLGRGCRKCCQLLRRLLRLLPLIWQWLLCAAAMVIVPLLFLLFFGISHAFLAQLFFFLWFVAACVADVAIVCYSAYAFGTLIKGAKAMARGNLYDKIPTKHLYGIFLDFARELNALADAAITAAKNQTKAERMRSELITNVSHDIKTPLTSLINYVDLLQSPHTPEQAQQYLEVLARQSKQMKKLIDDLMEMSKAASGSMSVEITTLDAAETVTQALGEFTDKLAAARLTPIFRPPQQPVLMQADGRLTWRVLSNLLSNAVKYSLPGTRLYVDIIPLTGCLQISLKNISAQSLNVSADELTERFVRGDASRNTEGSGLGLNIAMSLMQLQKGSLELLVDGDLFKVTLTFPCP